MRQIIFFLLLLAGTTAAQSPYRLAWGKDLAITGAGLSTGLLGLQLRSNLTLYTPASLSQLDASTINAFDRRAVDQYSTRAQNISDIFFYSSLATPLFFLPARLHRNDMAIITIMWFESAFLTTGVTVLTKYATQRTRPFVYNEQAPEADKLTTNAKSSFFSGHASMTAVSSFLAARVYADYFPDSKWKPVVWGVAATIPAVTGYLRVAGGKHFPTDVLTGYLVGAGIGILIPHFHRIRDTRSGFRIRGGTGGLAVSWTW
ncbi:MAG: phosphatase PAP2 family protein [Bacteroidetes bacterium]|nr:MAG: phosphatase PAP2 family protein [Bacteroidota bacterium]